MMREGVSKETFGTLSFCFIRLAMPKILCIDKKSNEFLCFVLNFS